MTTAPLSQPDGDADAREDAAEAGASRGPSESTLVVVRAARGGDRAALESLYLEFGATVHGLLLARVSAAEADDLVQEVFVKVLHALPSLRDERAFPAWLAQLTRRMAVDHLRRRRPTEELDETTAGTVDPDGLEADEVLAVIRGLPEAHVEPLMLRLVEGLTGPEIAERTGLTHGSVRVNLHRGMKLLRERLTGETS
ncbi:MAG: sigma-70 family RNA polymerase sigma factor [Acidobacteriota bacterium]